MCDFFSSESEAFFAASVWGKEGEGELSRAVQSGVNREYICASVRPSCAVCDAADGGMMARVSKGGGKGWNWVGTRNERPPHSARPSVRPNAENERKKGRKKEREGTTERVRTATS